MTHSDAFTEAAQKSTDGFEAANDVILRYTARSNSSTEYRQVHSYNFLTRLLIITNSYSSEIPATIIPFAQLDPDTLAFMHAKLKELNGNPPPVPVRDTPGAIDIKKNL